jgi:hypothetical protein
VATSRSAFADRKAVHHRVALPLLHAAVQRLGPVAVRVERFDERVDLEARAAEHQRRRGALDVEHALQRERLVRARHDVRDLSHPGQLAGRRLLARDRHPIRLGEVLLRDRQDARRHRRREERRLPGVRSGLEQRVEILGEAHVEHLVGLVEHEHLDGREVERAAAQEIERPAGRGDHDVDTAVERADLLAHRRAAVDGHHVDVGAAGVLVNGLGHLHRQLARGHEHEPTRAAPAVCGRFEKPVQHRQRERGGLAGAGLGLRQHVAAGEQERDGLALDGRRLLVAERGHVLDEAVGETGRGEAGRGGAWRRHVSIVTQSCMTGGVGVQDRREPSPLLDRCVVHHQRVRRR